MGGKKINRPSLDFTLLVEMKEEIKGSGCRKGVRLRSEVLDD